MTDEKEKKLLKDTIGDINVIDFALSGVCILFISVLLTMGNPKGSLEFALWSFSFAVGCFVLFDSINFVFPTHKIFIGLLEASS